MIITIIFTITFYHIIDGLNDDNQTTIDPNTSGEVQCDIGSSWVENFIKFNCINDSIGDNSIGAGVRIKAIGLTVYVRIIMLLFKGCVPTNINIGSMLQVGEIYDGRDFRYMCIQETDMITYSSTSNQISFYD